MSATSWGTLLGVQTTEIGGKIGVSIRALKPKMQRGQAGFVTGMLQFQHCPLATPLHGTIKPQSRMLEAHPWKPPSLLLAPTNRATVHKVSLPSTLTTRVLVSTQALCLPSSTVFLSIRELNHRCSTDPCILPIQDLMIVSRTIGVLDLVASSTFLIQETGPSISRVMTEVNCGLMEPVSSPITAHTACEKCQE